MDEDEGIKFIPSLVVIIALALVLLVFFAFAAYTIFLFAKWLVGVVW
jgi:preprotein translocase subunit Sec61beta